MEQVLEQLRNGNGRTAERGRVDAVLDTLTAERSSEETFAEVAHDARNMVAALSVYCDLLEQPGVLARRFAHYGSELRLVTAASRKLVERLMMLDAQGIEAAGTDMTADPQVESWPAVTPAPARRQVAPRWDPTLAVPIANLAEELLANLNVLAALAGPAVVITVQADGGARPVRMTGEDLTRILVNLVKNAVEAMPGGGRIRISLSERAAQQGSSPRVVIAVQDDGPGIPDKMLEKIFERGYTTHAFRSAPEGGWPAAHRGLGLAISRSLAEAAGGRLAAVKCAAGARLEIEPAGNNQGLELVAEVKALYPETSIVAMTVSSSVNAAVEAMRCGACDYLSKPFAMDELSTVLDRAAASHNLDSESRQLRERLRLSEGLGAMIGRSPEMEKLYRILSKVAQSSHPVLVLGESGTGKELVARTIHAYGTNSHKPFLPVDCASLAPTLIESELFGYTKGAFTGAARAKDGLLVSAESGTVFLDEVGELPLEMQAKLLRALQEKEVRPVGATHTIPIRARIVAATNRDLASMVEKGTFRKDLFYRLNVVNLRLPPLRDRREDIPLLTAHVLDRISRERGQKFTLSDEALRTMMRHDWPGNVRELENAVERACTMSSGPVLHLGDLPTQLQQQGLAMKQSPVKGETDGQGDAARVKTLADMEREAILDTIRALHGDKLQAAKLLGIGKTTLYRKLKECGIADPMKD
jgi:DNA-binding NtrC family response regulator/signal transduction histidine kinase